MRRLFLLAMVLLAGVLAGGCPRTPSGYLATVRAHIRPQSIQDLRGAVLRLRDFEGPLEIKTTSLCFDGKYYRRSLKSSVSVTVYDCYASSNFSDTGWIYSVSVSAQRECLREDVRREVDSLAEEIEKVLQQILPNAKVSRRSLETSYGFSLLPQ